MYEENKTSFVYKNIIIKFFLLVIVVIALVAFFPTKQYVENLIDEKIQVNKNTIFNTNINLMKEAAMSYYTSSRLPEKEDVITLKQMMEKNLILELTDSNNKQCNVDKSSVTITKNDSDYTLTTKLVCGGKTASIVSYMDSENQKKKLTSESTKECVYSKSESYTDWSSWTTTFISGTDTRQVDTKTVSVHVSDQQVQSGTNTIYQNPKKVEGIKNGIPFTIYICPSDFDNGGQYSIPEKCYKTVPNYITKPIYRNVTYYRYRDLIKTDEISSTCDNEELLNNGYTQKA